MRQWSNVKIDKTMKQGIKYRFYLLEARRFDSVINRAKSTDSRNGNTIERSRASLTPPY